MQPTPPPRMGINYIRTGVGDPIFFLKLWVLPGLAEPKSTHAYRSLPLVGLLPSSNSLLGADLEPRGNTIYAAAVSPSVDPTLPKINHLFTRVESEVDLDIPQ